MRATDDIDTVVVGAGQAGLATSYHLTDAARDHVVLDRGRVAERWRSERWDSLRLLTPTWLNSLPGRDELGPDLDGYLRAGELADQLEAYAASFDAPVVTGEAVELVEPAERGGRGYRVHTAKRTWRAANVVVATGWSDVPAVPAIAHDLAPHLRQMTAVTYRRPGDLLDGGVLVVGASASGVQIADELRRAGRHVVLAVGRHNRLPRTYRGMDVMWWLHVLGVLDASIDDIGDRERAVREPSWQLAGRPGPSPDLRTLEREGVVVTGHLRAAADTHAFFADDLPDTTGESEARLRRVLCRIEAFVLDQGLDGEVLGADPPPAFRPGPSPAALDLAAHGVTTVVWATGFRRSYRWLHVPVLDAQGEIRQRAGITAAPGLYTVGQRLQTRRNSSFIGGVGDDAAAVVAHINALRPRRPSPAVVRSRP
ncbi:MAG: flavin-containing monooxygenase [Kineosporiaceae bacterium]